MKKLLLSCLLLLALSFSFAQIPNAGFELWDNQPVPLLWETNSRPMTLPPWEPYIVRQDTEQYSGNYAANFWGNGIFKPFAKTTFAITAHPQALSLYYKLSFAPCVNDNGFPEKDTVSVLIEILNNGTVVDQGYWEKTSTSFNYSQLIVPISQNATVFDSCRITIYGGKVFGGCGIIAAPTEFKVDELELNYFSSNAPCIDSSAIRPTFNCHLNPTDTVCGCDGVAYFNDCDAKAKHGVMRYWRGACDTIHNFCQAAFSYDVSVQGPIVVVDFSDESVADSIISYYYDFDNGAQSSVPNPSSVYVVPGTYQPCLTIVSVNTLGDTCISTSCVTIPVSAPPTNNCTNTGIVTQSLNCLFIDTGGTLLLPCNVSLSQLGFSPGDTIRFSYTPNACASICMQGAGVDITCIDSSQSNTCNVSVSLNVHHPTSHVASNGHIIATTTGATPPLVFVWNPGGGNADSIGGLSNGTYCVTVSDVNGCSASACATLNGPNICIDSALICEPGSLCCDAPLFQPVCGCDSVTYTNACIATLWSGVTSYYDGACVTTGIKNSSSSQGIYLFPNPANDLLHVRYEAARSGKTEIRITNLLGQEVNSFVRAFEVSGTHTADINVSSFSSGVYILEVRTEGSRKLRKFTVE